ncbi:MAG: 2-oxoglutarate dehydrogenase complex dihydrolipoyllysine-residue succinyltransferase [candidate division Zixibacteria bacterium]|nr:2-oxoglutarate dehydrogenase complex dihydrolipoyllysine-residue succinyltransferase [candidate division Zixibacteria bacterium]
MAIDILVPELGESVVEATVGAWLKREGEAVTTGETLVELETDKVNLEVTAAGSGVLHITRRTGEDVKIGDVLGNIDEHEVASPTGDGHANTLPPVPDELDAHEERVTPVARRIAREAGVDVSELHGTGPGGRVTRQDVEHVIAEQKSTAPVSGRPLSPSPETPSPVTPPPVPSGADREEIVPMSRRRRTIAQRLVEAQHTAAMLTTFNEIDMTAVMDLRNRKREMFEKRHGIRLGFMSFFVKGSIAALKDFPPLNAEIRDQSIVLKRHYDIGIAVGAEEGLVVPVLRDADTLSFAEIEKGIKAFADRVKTGALSLEDLRGGTFTITNGGIFGSLLSTPILNPPQVGILGLHKITERPIALDGQVVIRPMMYVALSYDHRIVDGREAVQFLVRLKERIEDPACLLLDV